MSNLIKIEIEVVNTAPRAVQIKELTDTKETLMEQILSCEIGSKELEESQYCYHRACELLKKLG